MLPNVREAAHAENLLLKQHEVQVCAVLAHYSIWHENISDFSPQGATSRNHSAGGEALKPVSRQGSARAGAGA